MKQTVVVVDDDADILEFLETVLSLGDVRVITSDYTGDVVGLIQEVQPNTVLLDLQTRSDRHAGIRVLEQLRARSETANTRVVLMTADPLHLDKHATRIRELGAMPLPKPFKVDELLTLIEK